MHTITQLNNSAKEMKYAQWKLKKQLNMEEDKIGKHIEKRNRTNFPCT